MDFFNDYMFGFEIEVSNELYSPIIDLFEEYKKSKDIKRNWVFKPDLSIKNSDNTPGIYGGELVSPVIAGFIDEEEMSKVFEFFNDLQLTSNENCSSHLHVSAHILKRNVELYKRMTLFFMAYENVLYKILNGDEIKSNFDKFSRFTYHSLQNRIEEIINFDGEMSQFIDEFYPVREKALNLRNINDSTNKYTIELRYLKPVFDLETWKQRLHIIYKCMEYIKSDYYDQNLVLARISTNNQKELNNSAQTFVDDVNEQDIEELLNLVGTEPSLLNIYADNQKKAA